jgi:pyruvate dehydrogenase E2 component (dihydrolipoamide acetyltransferase)
MELRKAMSVSVSMPQLGESVTEGTVTRWLKREGEHVDADEPLLEVSTDKVDTEIPSPVSGTLRGITVAEDETVAVGAQLAVIDEEGAAGGAEQPQAAAPAGAAPAEPAPAQQEAPAQQQAPAQQEAGQPSPGYQQPAAASYQAPAYQPQTGYQAPPAYQPQGGGYEPQGGGYQPGYQQPGADQAQQAPANPYQQSAASYQPAAPAYPAAPPSAPPQDGHPYQGETAAPGPGPAAPAYGQQGYSAPQAPDSAGPPAPAPAPADEPAAGPDEQDEQDASAAEASGADASSANGSGSPYVTPLVRKLASEHGIDLTTVAGTGVGGRIRKQDVLDAARVSRDSAGTGAASPEPASTESASTELAPAAEPAATGSAPQATAPQSAPAAGPPAPAPAETAGDSRRARPAVTESGLRGTTERMSRARRVIAQRMVESLQTSAQLTTVVEADVTAIARLRERAKAGFEAREGVKLTFLPFFALAAVEALKAHPKLNSVIDIGSGEVTYHDAEHLGIAVDTQRGLMVPVIRNAGDLNIGGLARKIADLAARTRAGDVSPDDLAGGTFTLTNTGSVGALFDTPIINQPQVGILGTGTVVKRAVVVDDPALGEVITVRSMVYLALTYDHRLVDGADAARFLSTLKGRLEEGTFETELGL